MNSRVIGGSGRLFEKHLIDYDVGSNYGNWQYIAGVGSDPRGGRHFNLENKRLNMIQMAFLCQVGRCSTSATRLHHRRGRLANRQ